MGWLSCFVLPDSIFQYSLFSRLRQSWLCGCLLMVFAQLQAFLSLYTAVKGTVMCRYLCVYSCSAVHGHVAPILSVWICFLCARVWMALCPPNFEYIWIYVHIFPLMCPFVQSVCTWTSQCERICVLSTCRKNNFKSIIKEASQTADMWKYYNSVCLLIVNSSLYKNTCWDNQNSHLWFSNSTLKADLL